MPKGIGYGKNAGARHKKKTLKGLEGLMKDEKKKKEAAAKAGTKMKKKTLSGLRKLKRKMK